MTRWGRRPVAPSLRRGAAVTAALAGVVLAGWPATVVHAATTTLPACTNTSADVVALIAAIKAASGGDTIALATGCTYTITAADSVDNPGAPNGPDGLPPIAKTLTIAGNGATITRAAAAAAFRIFEVASAGDLTLENLTVSNGITTGQGFPTQLGGGIFNNGGTLTVRTSTLSGNSANGGAGGAIYNDDGTVTITTSTLSGNIANVDSGGFGGGIYTDFGTVTIEASTISGNNADNGDGGGVANDNGSVTVAASIVAGNIGGSCYGTITDGHFNLDDGTSCGFAAVSDKSSTNPKLGPLQDNSGPTDTLALLAGSPAIDAGPSGAACTSANGNFDQRGLPRPDVSGTVCDMGAFEFQAQVAPTPTPTPSVPPVPATGSGTPTSPLGAGVAIGGLTLALAAALARRRARDVP